MLYYTGPQYVEVGKGPEVGLPRKYTIVVAGAKGSSDIVGVIMNRKGRVICEIHIYRDAQGCRNFEFCDYKETICPTKP